MTAALMAAVLTILQGVGDCTAAPPYDDCLPVIEAAQPVIEQLGQDPDTRMVVYWFNRLSSDPELMNAFLADADGCAFYGDC